MSGKKKGAMRSILEILPFDPGRLPTKAAPLRGEKIVLRVEGYPPPKDVHASMRNPKHKWYPRFVLLRNAALRAMRGRAWYFGPIRMDSVIFAPGFERGLRMLDYNGGIMDALNGGHGTGFTYLPIAYQDDCQVCAGNSRIEVARTARYTVTIEFL